MLKKEKEIDNWEKKKKEICNSSIQAGQDFIKETLEKWESERKQLIYLK